MDSSDHSDKDSDIEHNTGDGNTQELELEQNDFQVVQLSNIISSIM